MLIAGYILLFSACGLDACDALPVTPEVMPKETCEQWIKLIHEKRPNHVLIW